MPISEGSASPRISHRAWVASFPATVSRRPPSARRQPPLLSAISFEATKGDRPTFTRPFFLSFLQLSCTVQTSAFHFLGAVYVLFAALVRRKTMYCLSPFCLMAHVVCPRPWRPSAVLGFGHQFRTVLYAMPGCSASPVVAFVTIDAQNVVVPAVPVNLWNVVGHAVDVGLRQICRTRGLRKRTFLRHPLLRRFAVGHLRVAIGCLSRMVEEHAAHQPPRSRS